MRNETWGGESKYSTPSYAVRTVPCERTREKNNVLEAELGWEGGEGGGVETQLTQIF